MSSTTAAGPNLSPPTSDATSGERPGETAPTQFSAEQIAGKVRSAGPAAQPVLLPRQFSGADEVLAEATAGVTATWRLSMTVTATWSINETRNAWMHVQSLGWRRLYNGKDGAFQALLTLAAQARQTGQPVTFREEPDGMVYEIYLW